jgi:hypothetical protein
MYVEKGYSSQHCRNRSRVDYLEENSSITVNIYQKLRRYFTTLDQDDQNDLMKKITQHIFGEFKYETVFSDKYLCYFCNFQKTDQSKQSLGQKP